MPLRDARRKLDSFEWACLALIAAGLSLRLWRIWQPDLVNDGARYAAMATSFTRYGEFLEPWVGPGVYSQHYPPLWPLLLAAAFATFGASLRAMAAMEALVGFALIVTALLTTWDLYGRRRGFAVAAVIATMSLFLTSEAVGLTESLVAASFAVTIWAILRSLESPRFILVAGVAAAAGYLTKSSVGPFFLIAGVAGFAWRFSYMRWRVFREKNYLAAAAIFGAVVLAWASRNVARHGWPNWETQPYATQSVKFLFRESPWWTILPAELAWSFVVLILIALPFLLPGFRDAARRWREESTSALWMAVVTPTLVASLFAAAFYANEHQSQLLSPDNVRYVLVCVVPLLWIGMRDLDLDARDEPGLATQGGERVRKRASLAVAGVVLLALILALRGTPPYVSLTTIVMSSALTLIALGLLLASRAYWWDAQARVDAKGARSWRAVRASAPRGRAAGAIALVLVGLAFGVFSWWDATPFFAAAGAALLLRSPRERVVAVAALLFAGSLSGASYAFAYDDATRDAAARMAPGESLAALGIEPAFVYAWAPITVNVTQETANASWLLDYRYGGDAPPEHYSTVAQYEGRFEAQPGTWLSWTLGFSPKPESLPGQVYLYHRSG